MGVTNTIGRWTDALLTGGVEGTDLAPRFEAVPLDVTPGDQLFLLPREDDLGAINIGDGTKDMDVKLFLGSTADIVLLDVGNSRVDFGADGNGLDVRMFGATSGSKLFWDESADQLELDAAILGEHRRPAPQTETSAKTLVESDSGKIFDNTGDLDAIIFTLPAVTVTGFHAWFFCVADFSLTVASAAGDDMVLDDDATADSIAFGTATEIMGNSLYVISDGTKWLCAVSLANEDVTVTIAT
ncbi:MAG: hypothetical protein V3S55_09400 [Nitrospiraceae bacterium]